MWNYLEVAIIFIGMSLITILIELLALMLLTVFVGGIIIHKLWIKVHGEEWIKREELKTKRLIHTTVEQLINKQDNEADFRKNLAKYMEDRDTVISASVVSVVSGSAVMNVTNTVTSVSFVTSSVASENK